MPYSPEFASLDSQSQAIGERNDCTVKAVAVVTGCTYNEAHAAMRAQGRVNGKGATKAQYAKALNKLGFDVENIWFESKTARTIERELKARHPGEKILIRQIRHVAGFNGEKIVDWSQGRCKKVVEVLRVTPAGQPQPATVVPEPKPQPKPVKPVTARKSSFKAQIRAALEAGYKVSVADFPGIKKSNYSIILSQLQNPKYAGKAGPLKIFREPRTGRAWVE